MMNKDNSMIFQTEQREEGYLTGQILVAMPAMQDPRFVKSIIYVCVHNQDGAMGLVLNRLAGNIKFMELLAQLELPTVAVNSDVPIHYGGPVEPGRGFVLHSLEYSQATTLDINNEIGLTATIDILRDIAKGKGPAHSLLTLGYAGWGPGQLDAEIQNNGWLTVAADEDLLFDKDIESKWERAFVKIGISPEMLSGDAGHA